MHCFVALAVTVMLHFTCPSYGKGHQQVPGSPSTRNALRPHTCVSTGGPAAPAQLRGQQHDTVALQLASVYLTPSCSWR